MKISIIAVGRLKERYLKDAVAEYTKRLSRFAAVNIIEIPDEKIPDNAGEKQQAQLLEKEGRQILQHIKDGYVIALCIEGRQLSSEELAKAISDITLSSSRLYFIIGGSLGLSQEVKNRAQLRLSFGKMTLPHQLMRVVLAEQIYRAFKINANEQYHK